ARQRNRRRGLGAIIRDYPWATTIFVLLLIGLGTLFVYQQKLGPWAPPGPPPQATCNLATHICNKAPLMTIDTSGKKLYTARVKTTKGDIVIQLDAKNAPIAVNNFVFLAQKDYYRNLYFWRAEKIGQVSPYSHQVNANLQLVQGGSVTADNQDKGSPPGYTIKDDAHWTGEYTEGAVAMAETSTPNTAGAQFFINTGDNSQALTAKSYPIFGHVVSGMDVAKAITAGDKILSVTITVTDAPKATATPSATSTVTQPAATATATK
ncbi:MAG: peptidylprolyl isomerase, partial [Ktedonobacterales bacterium]